MKNKIINGGIIFALVFAFVGVFSFGAEAGQGPHRVIVTFDGDDVVVNEAAHAVLHRVHGEFVKTLSLGNSMVVLVPDQAAIVRLSSLKGVKNVEIDARVFALRPTRCSPWPSCKNDGDGDDTPPPSQTLEWGVSRIDAPAAWGLSKGTAVKVAIIDTGIDQDHADLALNIKGGVNFTSKSWRKPADSSKWNDDNGHGTHVAGTVAALDNTIGVVGVAPEAHLYGVKVLDRNGSGYISDVIDGIGWAISNNMDVINMSLGLSSDIQAFHDAVDAAYDAGIVVVAAAGNSGDGDGSTNDVGYPAKYASVIAVAATASDDSTPSWSSDGAEVEVAAPGLSIRSTWNDGLYNTISGTSMASPHAAGVVALIIASGIVDLNNDGNINDEVRSILSGTSEDLGTLGRDVFYGFGLIDAEKAVQ